MKVASFREVILYLRQDEEADVKLGPNEEVVSSKVANINGQQRWVFIIKRMH